MKETIYTVLGIIGFFVFLFVAWLGGAFNYLPEPQQTSNIQETQQVYVQEKGYSIIDIDGMPCVWVKETILPPSHARNSGLSCAWESEAGQRIIANFED